MKTLSYRIFVSAIVSCSLIRALLAFTQLEPSTRRRLATPSCSISATLLAALTERQMQFWEDVEDGLDDVEQVYAAKGMDIDRIRKFGKR